MGIVPYADNPEISRSLVERDRDIILNALKIFSDDPNATVPFEAQMPELVGIVPVEERRFFDNPPVDYCYSGFNWDKAPEELSETVDQITQDLETIGRRVVDFTVSRAEFMLEDQNQKKHIDTGVISEEQASDIIYLVANRNHVLVHRGAGYMQWVDGLRLRGVSLGADFKRTETASVPDYGILRCTRATVHESDPPTHGLMVKNRVLMRPVFLY